MWPVSRLPPVQLHGVEVVAPAAVDQAVPRPAHRHVQHGPAHVPRQQRLRVGQVRGVVAQSLPPPGEGVQYSTAQYSTVHYSALQYSTVQYLVREYRRITQSCPAVTNISSRGPQWSPQNTWANIFSNRQYF